MSTPQALLRIPLRWVGKILGGALLYFTLVVTALVCVIGFRVLNRTRVLGAKNRGPRKHLLIVSNHQSLVDSFVVGMVIYFPWLFWRPNLAPSHLADARNFMTHPILRYVYQVLRVIPVGRNARGERRDSGAYATACGVLRNGGMLHVFIEGTRSIDQTLLPPKPQVGGLAFDTGATVRPIYITGLHAVHPYRKAPGDPPATWWRRLFGAHTEWLLDLRAGHQIAVVIGEDLTPDHICSLAGDGDHREQVTRLAEVIMEQIRKLKAKYEKSATSVSS